MNLYVYNGNNHTPKHGNLDLICSEFTDIAGDNKHFVSVDNTKIRPCTGCRVCSNGRGCHFDDMSAYDIEQCDGIVIFSPIYFFSFSANVKAFLDRLYAYNLNGKMITAITVSGSPTDSRYCGFDLIKEILKRTAEYCGAIYVEPLNFVTWDKKIDYPVHDDLECMIKKLEVAYETKKVKR